MGYLLETLGRGLLGELSSAFENQLPHNPDDTPARLRDRQQDSPRSLDLAMRLGLTCLRNMRLVEARNAFEHALELDAPSSQPALGLACVYDELGKLDEALRYLSIALAHDPNDPAIHFAIGFCEERKGDVTAATVAYERAVMLCPQLRNAHERLAAIAVRGSDWKNAIRSYEQLARLEPGNLDTLLTLADLYLQAGRPELASEQFQQALTIDPDLVGDTVSDADQLRHEGELEQAIGTVEALVAKYPDAAPFRIHLGDLYARIGDDTRAMEQYEVALQAHPDLLEAAVKVGTQHLRQGRYANAAQSFNRAVELNDRLMLAFVGLGMSQHAAGQEHEALATLDLAASLEPSTTLLFAEAARLHLQAQTDQVKHDEARLADEEPEFEPYAEEENDYLADEFDPLREAIRRHRQALLRSPNHADLHYRHGLLLRQVGDFDGAIEAFQNAVRINPGYSKALVKLGVCLKETGQTDEAIDVFRRALALDGEFVDVHYQLGLLFAQRNRFELAVEEFEQAIAGNANNPAFRANLALALQNIGMIDRAAATWRSILELTHDDDRLLEARDQVLRKINQATGNSE